MKALRLSSKCSPCSCFPCLVQIPGRELFQWWRLLLAGLGSVPGATDGGCSPYACPHRLCCAHLHSSPSAGTAGACGCGYVHRHTDRHLHTTARQCRRAVYTAEAAPAFICWNYFQWEHPLRTRMGKSLNYLFQLSLQNKACFLK